MTDQAAALPLPRARASMWKRVVATILDLLTTFVAGGIAIGWMTGNLKSNGFSLEGWPALALFAFVAVYFYLGRRRLGGTLWDRLFGIRRPQPR